MPQKKDKETLEIEKELKEDGLLPEDEEGEEGEEEETPETPEEPEESKKPKKPKKPKEGEESEEGEEGDEDEPESTEEEGGEDSKKGKKSKKDDDDDDDPDKKRSPRHIPIGKFQSFKKKSKDREQELLDEIEELKEDKGGGEASKSEVTKEVKKIAKEFDLDEKMVNALTEVILKQVKLPEDVLKKLKDVGDLKESDQFKKEDDQFDRDFDKVILKLIKEEHPKVTDEEIKGMQDDLRKLAFTEEYAKTPLHVIYKGVDDFRPGKSSAESSRGGSSKGGEGTKDDAFFEKIKDNPTEIAKLTEKEFGELEKYLAKSSGGARIRRKGEE